MTTRACSSCRRVLPITDFQKNGVSPTGKPIRRYRCTACWSIHRRYPSPRNRLLFLLPKVRDRARTQGVPYGLTLSYAISLLDAQAGLCALTGTPLTYHASRPPHPTALSVDRINPRSGYIPGNVRFVCFRANVMRSNMTDDELFLWCERILAQLGS